MNSWIKWNKTVRGTVACHRNVVKTGKYSFHRCSLGPVTNNAAIDSMNPTHSLQLLVVSRSLLTHTHTHTKN